MAACNKDTVKLSARDEQVLHSIFNPHEPLNQNLDNEPDEVDADEDLPEFKASKTLEIQGVEAAERGELEKSLELLSNSILASPSRASPYNNRAQTRQLIGDLEGSKSDLDEAIRLSSGKKKVLGQALTQRGIIKRFEGDDTGALHDFQKAAALGNPIAKQMSAALNPYAAMCGQMLAEVFAKIEKGET